MVSLKIQPEDYLKCEDYDNQKIKLYVGPRFILIAIFLHNRHKCMLALYNLWLAQFVYIRISIDTMKLSWCCRCITVLTHDRVYLCGTNTTFYALANSKLILLFRRFLRYGENVLRQPLTLFILSNGVWRG